MKMICHGAKNSFVSIIMFTMTGFCIITAPVNAQNPGSTGNPVIAEKGNENNLIIPGSNSISLVDNLNNETGARQKSSRSAMNLQTISARLGWSGISSYILPDDPTIENLFQQVENELIILYNPDGIYYPAEQINTLINWHPYSGYVAKFGQQTNIEFSGQPLQNLSVSLAVGWNLMPVLASCSVSIAELFSGHDLEMIKEVAGYRLYWPDMEITTLTELEPGSAYFVYMNSADEIAFWDCAPPWLCGDLIIDDRDGKSYATVQIGQQCWMAENLNTGTMISGSVNQQNNGSIEKYCYNNTPGNCDEFGGLYQWDEMMQYSINPSIQGICPEGWHLPNNSEWCTLEQILDSQVDCSSTGWRGTTVGTKLKSGGDSGFNALLVGYSNSSGVFWGTNLYTHFWVSSSDGPFGWSRALKNDNTGILRNSYDRLFGFSVRCISDISIPNLPPNTPTDPAPEDGSTNMQINTTLSWTCSDPENDMLSYNVHFGKTNPPPLVSARQPDENFDPGVLDYLSTYYWKIVAFDEFENSTEGVTWSFSTIDFPPFVQCGDILYDTRDGKPYSTIQIGTQCWMSQNLNVGSIIGSVSNMGNNGIIEKYCYQNSPVNCQEYGGLYQWGEAMGYSNIPGSTGICPEGWHLPDDLEFCILEQFLEQSITCESTGWRGESAGTLLQYGGSSGFNALMAGFRLSTPDFYGLANYTHFWVSSEDALKGWSRGLHAGDVKIIRYSYDKSHGFSIRCLKN